MSKIKLFPALFTFALLAVFAVSVASLASAHEAEVPHEEPDQATSTAVAGEEITLEDLGVTRTGILPTNPFYFVKEWGRNIRLFFTPDPIKKTGLELRFVNEKAAELKKVTENNPQDTEAIGKAISNYNRNIDRLRARLESLKETSSNPNIDELLERLTDRTVRHQQLFEELKETHQDLRDELGRTQDKIDETLSRLPEKLDNPDKFKERLERILEKQKESELKNLEVRSRLLKIREKVEERVKDKDEIDAVACTLDAKLCPDGSYVGRVP
ncbi:MAG: hypothetical protein HYW38_00770, partial [Candidatus Colwellbacteria bacterium]|nr:hypothetical protein [Candidatus Colwellbacteria bacterium]